MTFCGAAFEIVLSEGFVVGFPFSAQPNSAATAQRQKVVTFLFMGAPFVCKFVLFTKILGLLLTSALVVRIDSPPALGRLLGAEVRLSHSFVFDVA